MNQHPSSPPFSPHHPHARHPTGQSLSSPSPYAQNPPAGSLFYNNVYPSSGGPLFPHFAASPYQHEGTASSLSSRCTALSTVQELFQGVNAAQLYELATSGTYLRRTLETMTTRSQAAHEQYFALNSAIQQQRTDLELAEKPVEQMRDALAMELKKAEEQVEFIAKGKKILKAAEEHKIHFGFILGHEKGRPPVITKEILEGLSSKGAIDFLADDVSQVASKMWIPNFDTVNNTEDTEAYNILSALYENKFYKNKSYQTIITYYCEKGVISEEYYKILQEHIPMSTKDTTATRQALISICLGLVPDGYSGFTRQTKFGFPVWQNKPHSAAAAAHASTSPMAVDTASSSTAQAPGTTSAIFDFSNSAFASSAPAISAQAQTAPSAHTPAAGFSFTGNPFDKQSNGSKENGADRK